MYCVLSTRGGGVKFGVIPLLDFSSYAIVTRQQQLNQPAAAATTDVAASSYPRFLCLLKPSFQKQPKNSQPTLK